MKADIDVTVSYPHPPGLVWEALTSSEALTAWLMPNGFKPVVGHRFTFRAKPAPRFDGIARRPHRVMAAGRRAGAAVSERSGVRR